MKKILLLEPYSPQGLALSKYLRTYGNFHLVAYSEKEEPFGEKHYDEIRIGDFSDIRPDGYDYILPTGAKSTFEVLRRLKTLSFANRLTLSENNLVAFDKHLMLRLADETGVPIPRTFHHPNEIDAFPVFYKENFERGGGIRGIACEWSDIPQSDRLIYQEFIDTPATYGVGFLAKGGKILTYTAHKEVLSYPKTGGSAVVIESFDDERLLVYTQKLLEKTAFEGWGLAEFKFCEKRKDFVFMEINAKFWASIGFALRNNPAFLELLLGVSAEKNSTKKTVYINRWLRYGWPDMVKALAYFGGADFIKEYPVSYQILRKLTPQAVVDILKKGMK